MLMYWILVSHALWGTTAVIFFKLPSEVISVHVGQAGVSIGDASWELYCLEHGIEPDGQISTTSQELSTLNITNTFFSETVSGLRVPNAVFLDTEPSAVDL